MKAVLSLALITAFSAFLLLGGTAGFSSHSHLCPVSVFSGSFCPPAVSLLNSISHHLGGLATIFQAPVSFLLLFLALFTLAIYFLSRLNPPASFPISPIFFLVFIFPSVLSQRRWLNLHYHVPAAIF